ncbi:MAG: DUF362 domain-containing protein [Lentisphaerae bacterium]|nr:DUF362 domain-containing protein [Lentisphaerota bacterium]
MGTIPRIRPECPPMRTMVSLARCTDYSSNLFQAVEQVLAPLGGMKAFVRPGQSVLIKPNLLTDTEPGQGVTTHPEVVRAILRHVRACGAIPFVGDSPASVIKLENVWRKTGFEALCREEAVALVNLDRAGAEVFTVVDATLGIAKPVLEAHVIINVPKLKTHVLTILTNAVKNMYGVIPGYQKTLLHRRFPTPRVFGVLLAALYGRVKPALNITDAIVGMEGNGPSGGSPAPLGFLAASADAAALDLAMCHMLGIPPHVVPYLKEVKRLKLGETDWANIDMLGEPLEALKPKRFKLPSTVPGRLIPGWLLILLDRLIWIRPEIDEHCVFCGLCVKSCPVGALSIEKGRRPVLDENKCVGCCCCHEVCPHQAIAMRSSPLLRLFSKGELPS